MRTNIRYVLLCALRDRLFIGMFVGIIAAALLSVALGNTAFLEEKEMTLAFASASARMILMIGLIVFICFHIRSAFDSREIDVMLSRPISRTRLVLDYWLAFAIIALLLLLPAIAVVMLIRPPSLPGFGFWAASLLLESWIVVALALFAALLLKSAVSAVLSSLGFYVLSRIMIYFILTAESPLSGKFTLIHLLLKFISAAVPRLDLFAKSEWLIYGLKASQEWSLFLLQALIYIPLLLVMAIIDFRRKQF